MVKAKFKVTNEKGIHARPSAELVKLTAKFKSEIRFGNGHFDVNGKSLLEVMKLGVARNGTLHVKAKGEDEKKLVSAIQKLVEVDNFNE